MNEASFRVGAKLGPYDIVGILGAGGMGTVYRARDSKLKRDVAIKVLPRASSQDRDRILRFQREAETLASLNHPNIGGIYDSHEIQGSRFLVLELVEGETLAERIERGRLSVEDSLGFALQIAAALEDAHEKGIVHRDLKPANIKVSKSGTIKILDFGLAKLLTPITDASMSNAPTVEASQLGMILGTASYMSPEQARGQDVDRRTDIWAFGCVLLEMLTGHRAFAGTSPADILGAVVHGSPSWEDFPAGVDPELRNLLDRCLEKNPRSRWHDIADVRIGLERIQADPWERPTASMMPSARPSSFLVRSWLIVAAAAALLGVGLLYRASSPTATSPIWRFSITAQDGDHSELFGVASGYDLVMAPDDSALVYLARNQGITRLYRRPRNAFNSSQLPGTEGAYEPFFSPDAQSLGFLSGSKLKIMKFPDGTPLDIADLGANASGATWIDKDNIIVGMRATGLVRVSISSGKVESLTVPDPARGETEHNWPEALPGGRGILFTVQHGPGLINARIAVRSSDNGTWEVLFDEEGYNARYVSMSGMGFILYGRSGLMMAKPFDLERKQVKGASFQALDSPVFTKPAGAQVFSVSPNGSLAFVSPATNSAELVWMSRDGVTVEPLSKHVRQFLSPDVSPDGRRVAVDIAGEAWIHTLESGNLTRLVMGEATSATPFWNNDGTQVSVIRERSKLSIASVEGNVMPDPLFQPKTQIWGGRWSPDGEFVLVNQLTAQSGPDLWAVSVKSRQATPYLQGPADENWAVFSPQGHWVAYTSDESGEPKVYASRFPEPIGRPVEISAGRGTKPLWFGNELFYRQGERVVVVLIEERAAELNILERKELPVRLPNEGGNLAGYDYDYDPNSKRFLVVRPVAADLTPRISVVPNWFGEQMRFAKTP